MIIVTATAAKRIKIIQEEHDLQDHGLRVAVRGGGCSGLMYNLEFVAEPEPGDYTWKQQDVIVYCDPKSYLYLVGTELDFKETVMESGFEFNNPNSRKSCGCGESFSI